jgi:hypothetical protein
MAFYSADMFMPHATPVVRALTSAATQAAPVAPTQAQPQTDRYPLPQGATRDTGQGGFNTKIGAYVDYGHPFSHATNQSLAPAHPSAAAPAAAANPTPPQARGGTVETALGLANAPASDTQYVDSGSTPWGRAAQTIIHGGNPNAVQMAALKQHVGKNYGFIWDNPVYTVINRPNPFGAKPGVEVPYTPDVGAWANFPKLYEQSPWKAKMAEWKWNNPASTIGYENGTPMVLNDPQMYSLISYLKRNAPELYTRPDIHAMGA